MKYIKNNYKTTGKRSSFGLLQIWPEEESLQEPDWLQISATAKCSLR